jgi:hypothetical protein
MGCAAAPNLGASFKSDTLHALVCCCFAADRRTSQLPRPSARIISGRPFSRLPRDGRFPTDDRACRGPRGTTNPVGAYEQREAAIGCAAVVKVLGSTPLPALRTGSRASALLQIIAFAADPVRHHKPCRSARAPRGRDRLRSSPKSVGLNTIASAAHWIASKLAPTDDRVCRRSNGHHNSASARRAWELTRRRWAAQRPQTWEPRSNLTHCMRWFAAALQQIAGQASSHGLRSES